jgi:hypothetical protein
MAQVICEVSPGLRPTEKTVAVKDVRGPRQFLRVEGGLLIHEKGRSFLPVGVVGVDEERRLALIELPHEADSGANRLWVRLEDVKSEEPAPGFCRIGRSMDKMVYPWRLLPRKRGIDTILAPAAGPR